MKQHSAPPKRQIMIMFLTAAASMAIFYLSYTYDNKYSARSVQPIGGVLFFGQEETLTWLVNGWQYYENRLLSPEDFETDTPPLPDRYVSIGQYPAMDFPGRRDTHGSASYRLLLSLPDQPAMYTLELPEIYSSYRLYIDGRLLAACGTPDPERYVPRLRSGSLTFQASGDIELLISVSDWDYLYSGMVYPPAFGSPKSVSSVLDIRYTWYVFVLSLAGVMGCIQTGVSIFLRNRKALYSALVCFCFSGMSMGTAVHRLCATGIVPFYNVEIFCRYGLYGFAALMVHEMCGEKSRFSRWCALSFSLFPWAAALMPLAAPWLSAQGIHTFSYVSEAYKVSCSLWMLCRIFKKTRSFVCQTSDLLLLAGSGALASSLAADRIFPMFEPICFGWFSELAGFSFSVCLSLALFCDCAYLYRQREDLQREKEQLALQIRMQKEHYQNITGQMEAIRITRHNIRYHLTKLSLLLDDKNYEACKEYLDALCENTGKASPLRFCQAYGTDVLLRYYYALAEREGITAAVQADVPENLGVPEEDLSVIIGNLFENALEASRKLPPKDRFVSIQILHKNGALIIKSANHFTGTLTPEGGGFRSSKDPGRKGLGIPSVRATVEKYDGNLWIDTEMDGGVPMFIIQAFVLCQ